ncbi:deoxyhypusine hydroxylase [Stylonychia lemnae]|uniref:Deoxyhypusine hydroxylase n=1 Tax=Stylonychia lemnae TaxID=5949 RepID=A0A078AU57_STYLE|nr:deoxyhypusine hydroxylase [Stylonychia lemnae]|eukprot:CDW84373.1 deoxyhypusine hydroxylase [Stylonychia lemnae]
MIWIDHDKVSEYAATLQDLTLPIPKRVSSLWCLRTVSSLECLDALFRAFEIEQSSELLKHEICYALGQMDKSPEHIEKIQNFLEKVLDEDHPKIVLHEAVEALGNINSENTLKLLKRFENETSEILYETCFLTIKLVEWREKTENGKTEGLNLSKLKFNTTNDPAPPFNFVREPKYKDIQLLESIILDNENYDLFERYRALFTLRELNTEEAVIAMCQCMTKENSKKCSALLKHEVAFILAQMEEVFKVSIPFLIDCVANEEEAPIVRHEVLVSLGDMIDDKSLLEQFVNHPDQIVNESCQVAFSYIDNRKAVQEEERLINAQ